MSLVESVEIVTAGESDSVRLRQFAIEAGERETPVTTHSSRRCLQYLRDLLLTQPAEVSNFNDLEALAPMLC